MKHTTEDVRNVAKPARKRAIGTRLAAGVVIVSIGILTAAVGTPFTAQDPQTPPSPPWEIVNAIKSAFEGDSIPRLTESQVQQLSRHFEDVIEGDGLNLVVDTAPARNHSKWMWKEHLRLIDPQDPEATIEGPPGLIRPVDGSQHNKDSTLREGQWIARIEVGPPGVPARNLPGGVSYLLVIQLASPISQRLLDSLSWDRIQNVGSVLVSYHQAVHHVIRPPLAPIGPRDPHHPSHKVPPGRERFYQDMMRYLKPLLANDTAKARALAIHVVPPGEEIEVSDGVQAVASEDLGRLIGVIVPAAPPYVVRYNVMRRYPTGSDVKDPIARAMWRAGANDNACMNGCQGWCDFY